MGKIKKHKDEEEPEPTGILNHTICQVRTCLGRLSEEGFCEMGQGYPFYMERQPAVCPTCRKRLHWTGNCMECWDTYTKTGPGYYFEERNWHWVNTGEKQTMFSKEQNIAALKILQEMMLGLNGDFALERINRILNPEVPF